MNENSLNIEDNTLNFETINKNLTKKDLLLVHLLKILV